MIDPFEENDFSRSNKGERVKDERHFDSNDFYYRRYREKSQQHQEDTKRQWYSHSEKPAEDISVSGLNRALVVFGLTVPFTADQLKKSYRVAAMKHHPDRGGSEESMKNINVLYETLKAYAS